MEELKVFLSHGEGGKATHRFIRELFLPYLGNKIINKMEDAALLSLGNSKFALSTDAFVIEPIIFPGGNIGKLAVSGTVNDLASMGAKPLWFLSTFIIEEGLDIKVLEKIVRSFSDTLNSVSAILVAADTKVVPRGQAGGGIYISTAGIGKIVIDSTPENIVPGDEIVISGDIARHSAAILAAREKLETHPPLVSDCAPLWNIVELAMNSGIEIHAMRDPTRGGLATVCVEISESTGLGMEIYENSIPINPQVSKLCDIYGFDPLYLANEGKMLFFVRKGEGEKLVKVLHNHPLGKYAAVIGKVVEEKDVILHTKTGGKRKLIMLEGAQLPRIC